MPTKCLLGELNNTAARAKYTGKSTSSLRINVDNENMILSGDVIWDDALGEIACKAYPGDKGARNYAKIQELTAKLNNELTQANKFRVTSSTDLKRILKTLQDLKETIENETARAQDEENDIYTKLSQEIDRSSRMDNDLLERIQKENAARKKANSDIISMLNGCSFDLSGEEKRAKQAEAQLSLKIDKVEDRLKEEDSRIQTSLSELLVQMSENTVPAATTDGTPYVYTVTGNFQHTTPVSEHAVPESVVKRDAYGNIHISDEALLVESSAVSKSYVDNAVGTAQKSIQLLLSEYEFIDGGTAPI